MTDNAIRIDFEPLGKRVEVSRGCSLLEATQTAGIELVSVCGGAGTCEQCKVQIISGQAASANLIEQAAFTDAQIRDGWRLACQTNVNDAMKVYIPPASLTTPQRLQTEGVEVVSSCTPTYQVAQLKSLPADRLKQAKEVFTPSRFLHRDGQKTNEKPVLFNPEMKVVYRSDQPVLFIGPAEHVYGVAVDLGTTKIAAYLVDLQSNSIIAKSSAPNPQIHYGEDIISRIHFCMEHVDGQKLMQTKVAETLNALFEQMCAQAGTSLDFVIEGVVVGNTAMHHLFAGLPVAQLGLAPFTPAVTQAITIDARDLGLTLSPAAKIYMPEIIAGYVGADHVAMMTASVDSESKDTVLAIDIGTNTEISLTRGESIFSCSCASGPAFEGAHIQEGMRAAEGSIERIKIEENNVQYQTIGNIPPIGICGSGILDAIAELRRNEIINERGNFCTHPRVRGEGNKKEFVLVPVEKTGSGHDIVITRRDINEILLAKAAIQTGIDILLKTAGIDAADLDQIIIAGAFGTYLDLTSAIQIGMFPDLPLATYKQVGNAAGMGARMMLISDDFRIRGRNLVDRTCYVELTLFPEFQKIYLGALKFPAAII